MNKRLFISLVLFLGWMGESLAEEQLFALIQKGERAKRINLVILAEGYTSSEVSSFTNHAATVAKRLLDTPPYRFYKDFFNVFAIFVSSPESGSDHPPSILRDTYFNSTYNTRGVARLLTIPPNDRNPNWSDGQGKVNDLLLRLLPEYDISLLLVNDLEYGGSGGQVAVTSINSSAAEIAIHEIGHSFAGLGDEYDDPAPASPVEEPNTTRETRREFIKWNSWIEPSTPIPTPETSDFSDLVGLFEGAHYNPAGWYRPKLDCKMKTLGQPFCEVCSEALVIAKYMRIDLIDSQSPSGPEVVLKAGNKQLFKVSTPKPEPDSFTYSWTLDEAALPGAHGSELLLDTSTLAPGSYRLQVMLRDQTPLVRNDPLNRVRKFAAWTVEVQPGETPELVTIPPVITENQFRVAFQSNVPADLLLLASTDLVEWIPIQTNRAATTLTWTIPLPDQDHHRFFRAELHTPR